MDQFGENSILRSKTYLKTNNFAFDFTSLEKEHFSPAAHSTSRKRSLVLGAFTGSRGVESYCMKIKIGQQNPYNT